MITYRHVADICGWDEKGSHFVSSHRIYQSMTTHGVDRVERPDDPEERRELRRGWTTGACATAATKAAMIGLVTGQFPDPVEIVLPKGERPSFVLAEEYLGEGLARTGIIKDAGDDPDVTHGALVCSTVRFGALGSGVTFRAGDGVGMITKAGLPLPPGEPAINPVPRQMMQDVVGQIADQYGCASDVEVEISIRDGERLAVRTWNPRLGIVGGLSVLGTTGVVHPFSCSAWIHSIHRGIDVAVANRFLRIAGSTGSTSEAAVQAHYDLPELALIDMGDFVGGMLKYLRRHPVPNVAIAGGFAKLTKLAQGAMDLHSGRSQVDFDWLAAAVTALGGGTALGDAVRQANTASEVLSLCRHANVDIASHVAAGARARAVTMLQGAPVGIEVLVVTREGEIIAHAQ